MPSANIIQYFTSYFMLPSPYIIVYKKMPKFAIVQTETRMDGAMKIMCYLMSKSANITIRARPTVEP